MVDVDFRISVSHNRLWEIIHFMPERADALVERTAVEIAGDAMSRTPPRVDTGAMMNGYIAGRIGQARWVVYNTQHYHIYNELGTYKLAAHPMLIPAAEAAREHFVRSVAHMLEGLEALA